MTFTKFLICRECGSEFPISPINVCDYCFGPLDVEYDFEKIRQIISRERIIEGPLSIWRYKDLLPSSYEYAVDLQAGFTPLLHAKNLGKILGLDNLYLKNDSVNPSYSFKDRVVSVAATKAKEFNIDTLACASTGNLAGSVGAHASRGGMRGVVFIPSNLEKGKIIGAAIYGATLVSVNGTYDDVNRLCSEIADNYKWAFVNINMRPYYAEGSKTLGFEAAEQFGWQTPDHAVVPAASGALYTKIWKGFEEFYDLGLLNGKVNTHMHLAQPEGCSPIVSAWNEKSPQIIPVKPNTVAHSLAIGNPADGMYALKLIKESAGSAIAVPESEISEGIKLLAETEGIFTETAGGVVVSSLKNLVKEKRIKKSESVIAFITGNGLKTQEAVESVVNPIEISPTFSEFEKIYSKLT